MHFLKHDINYTSINHHTCCINIKDFYLEIKYEILPATFSCDDFVKFKVLCQCIVIVGKKR